MDFKDLIYVRQSTRKFKREKLDIKDIELCVEASRMSPSAMNSCPYNLYIASGDTAKKIASARGPYNSFIDNCPTFAIFTARKSALTSKVGSKFTGRDFTSIDTGISVMSFCYQAEEFGIGTCILGIFKEDEIKRALSISEKVLLVVAMGYKEDSYPLREKKRRKFEDFVKFFD